MWGQKNEENVSREMHHVMICYNQFFVENKQMAESIALINNLHTSQNDTRDKGRFNIVHTWCIYDMFVVQSFVVNRFDRETMSSSHFDKTDKASMHQM